MTAPADDEIPKAWFPRVAFLPLRRDQEPSRPAVVAEKEEPKRTVTCKVCGETGHNSRRHRP